MAAGGGNSYSFRDIVADMSDIFANLGKVLYTLNPDLDDKVDKLYQDLKEVKEKGGTVHIISREGRSGHVGASLGLRLLHFGLDVSYLGDSIIKRILEDAICFCYSGSGGTGDTVSNANTAKDAGAKLKIFTSYVDSPLARLANSPIDIFILPGGLKMGAWEYIPSQIGIKTVPQDTLYNKHFEEITGPLQKIRNTFYLGGGFESIATIFNEMLISEIGRRFEVTQEQAADKHIRDKLKA
jgi:hypothetical protein